MLEKIKKDNVTYVFGDNDRIRRLSKWLDKKDLFADVTLHGTINSKYTCLVLDDVYGSSIMVEADKINKLFTKVLEYVVETYQEYDICTALKDKKAAYLEHKAYAINLLNNEKLGEIFDIIYKSYGLFKNSDMRGSLRVMRQSYDVINSVKVDYIDNILSDDDFS